MADVERPIGEASPDGRWLTYAELAHIRGIGRESAAKLAQREKWRRQAGNGRDRQARVFVPAEWMIPARVTSTPETTPGLSGELSGMISRLDAAITTIRAAHAGETAALREQLAAVGQERDGIRSERDQERARADALRDRVEAKEADLALIRAALDQTQTEARKAHAEVGTLRQEDAARKGRGRLARLRAAWRGE